MFTDLLNHLLYNYIRGIRNVWSTSIYPLWLLNRTSPEQQGGWLIAFLSIMNHINCCIHKLWVAYLIGMKLFHYRLAYLQSHSISAALRENWLTDAKSVYKRHIREQEPFMLKNKYGEKCFPNKLYKRHLS